jgi:hypothetical protein
LRPIVSIAIDAVVLSDGGGDTILTLVMKLEDPCSGWYSHFGEGVKTDEDNDELGTLKKYVKGLY